MPTGFDENNALNRMQMDSPASSGPMSRGGIAGFGRQIRKNASGRGIDPVVDLENKARCGLPFTVYLFFVNINRTSTIFL